MIKASADHGERAPSARDPDGGPAGGDTNRIQHCHALFGTEDTAFT